MKLLATRKAHQNRAALDPWTVVHFGTGLALGLIDIPARHALGLSVAYEVAEQYIEREDWGQEFFETSRPESLANAAVDVAVFGLGLWLGRRWNRT